MAFLSDLRSALRSFLKSPGFFAVSVATLGLGIGATTAMFTILSAVLLRPLPYPAAERLVFVRDIQPQLRDLPASYPEYLDWSSLDLFEGIGAYWRPSANLTGEGEPERIDVCRWANVTTLEGCTANRGGWVVAGSTYAQQWPTLVPAGRRAACIVET